MVRLTYGVKDRKKYVKARKGKEEISERDLIRELVGNHELSFSNPPISKEEYTKNVVVNIMYTDEELEITPVVLFDGLELRDKNSVKNEIRCLVKDIKKWIAECDMEETITFR